MGDKKWYAVHTYSGYENKVRGSLLERVRLANMQEQFEEVLIPTENVIEMKKGERKTTTRKFFPGYILVKMDLNQETYHLVRNTPKVTGFVGGSLNFQSVPSIPDEDVRRITNRMTEGALKPKPKVAFEEGENIRVIDGPFSNFNGIVEEVKPDKGKVRVLVSIFGRATPVELDFVQVEKA